MPQRANNRIEVDLKLLQDRNIEKLLDFGSSFDASITRLAQALEATQQGFEGGGPNAAVQNAGKIGPNASTGADIKTPKASQARTPGAFANTPTSGLPPMNEEYGAYDQSAGSYAPGGPTDTESFEKQYVRASRRIGSIPVGFRQALGYFAEGGPAPGESPDSAFKSTLRGAAGSINSSLFTAQAVSANASLGYQHIQSAYGMIQGPTQLGQQLGLSREGGLAGTGFLSPAFSRGLSEIWQTAQNATFGFNPNYSMAQSRSATQALEQYGYSASTGVGGAIANQLKQLQIHQGLDPNSMMDILDPFVRFGGGYGQSGQSLIETLRAIPAAANAASMNLKVFTQDLVATSTSIAQSWGITPGQVAGSLEAMSSTTGLAPSALKGLYDTSNVYMAAALTGTPISKIVNNPKGSEMLAAPMKYISDQLGGHSAKQVIEGFQKNEPWALSIMNGLTIQQLTQGSLLYGLNVRSILNSMARNGGAQGVLQHTALTQTLDSMNPQRKGSIDQMQTILGTYGGGLESKFEKWRQQNEGSVKTAQQLRSYRQRAQTEAESLMSGKQKRAGRQVAHIVMTGETRKFFKLLQNWEGQQDVGNRNQKSFFSRLANASGLEAVKPYLHDLSGLGGAISSAAGGVASGYDAAANFSQGLADDIGLGG